MYVHFAAVLLSLCAATAHAARVTNITSENTTRSWISKGGDTLNGDNVTSTLGSITTTSSLHHLNHAGNGDRFLWGRGSTHITTGPIGPDGESYDWASWLTQHAWFTLAEPAHLKLEYHAQHTGTDGAIDFWLINSANEFVAGDFTDANHFDFAQTLLLQADTYHLVAQLTHGAVHDEGSSSGSYSIRATMAPQSNAFQGGLALLALIAIGRRLRSTHPPLT